MCCERLWRNIVQSSVLKEYSNRLKMSSSAFGMCVKEQRRKKNDRTLFVFVAGSLPGIPSLIYVHVYAMLFRLIDGYRSLSLSRANLVRNILYYIAMELHCITLYIYWIALQRIALCFNVLHCIVLYCGILLHCIALHCIVLHCTSLQCIILCCVELHCISLFCFYYIFFCAVWYSMVWYVMVWYCIVLYNIYRIAFHCIALHCITLYSMVFCCIVKLMLKLKRTGSE